MFIVRSAAKEDLSDLQWLSEMVFFINLPNDLKIITEKIEKSIKSFQNPSKNLKENVYLFVLEDLEKNKVIGASMIHAQHGSEDEPHFYLKVAQEYKYSDTINTGFIHGTLKLGLNTNGPTEIGGLVLAPEYRGHKEKLGKFLSFARLLYIAKNKTHFKDVVHSELMPPLDKEGKSPLWEAIGRRFMNMDYTEADLLSRNNKEFILSLYPSENIYQTLLPIHARNAIGKVGKATKPVQAMLEKIGFTYSEEVDPFDGGPHYNCKTEDITTVKSFKKLKLVVDKDLNDDHLPEYLVQADHKDYVFVCFKLKGIIKDNQFIVKEKLFEEYLQPTDEICIVDF